MINESRMRELAGINEAKDFDKIPDFKNFAIQVERLMKKEGMRWSMSSFSNDKFIAKWLNVKYNGKKVNIILDATGSKTVLSIDGQEHILKKIEIADAFEIIKGEL